MSKNNATIEFNNFVDQVADATKKRFAEFIDEKGDSWKIESLEDLFKRLLFNVSAASMREPQFMGESLRTHLADVFVYGTFIWARSTEINAIGGE